VLVANTDKTNQYFASSCRFYQGSEEFDGNLKKDREAG
jgi:hypothetical protein